MEETEKFSKSQIEALKHIQKKGLQRIIVRAMGRQHVQNWRSLWKQGILRHGIRKCSARMFMN